MKVDRKKIIEIVTAPETQAKMVQCINESLASFVAEKQAKLEEEQREFEEYCKKVFKNGVN